MIQVLVLDPHPIIHAGFQKIFSPTGKFNLHPPCYKFKQLYPLLEQTSADLLVMELDLLEASPVSIVEHITKNHPAIKIIIFTQQPINIFAISVLKAGAHAFLSKRTPSTLLLEAFLFVHQTGEKVISKHHSALEYNVDIKRPRNSYGNLSPREIEVLKHLIDGKKNVTIAKMVGISQKTVNTYKKRLLEKLGANSFHELYSQTKLFIPV